MHPKFNLIKVYEVKLFGLINESLLKKLRNGVRVSGEMLKPLGVRVIKNLPGKTWLEIRLGEGKNREIRNLCEACGMTVDKLKRVAIGGLSIQGIAPGNYRFYSKKQLLKELGMKEDGSKAQDKTFVSVKKTAKLPQKENRRRKEQKEKIYADHPTFKKFRKESYFETLKTIKEKKQEEEGE